MGTMNLGVAVRGLGGAPDRSLKSLGPAVAGLAMLAAAVVVLWGPQKWTGSWGGFAVAGLSVAGSAVFLVSLLRRVSVRQRELERDSAAAAEDLAAAAERVRSAEAARRQTEALLAAVPSRLVVVDRDLTIRASHSSRLESLFRTDRREQRTFLDLLRGKVQPDAVESAKAHLAALFDTANDENNLAAANPLTAVEVAASQPDGTLLIRHVKFEFRRIYEDGAVGAVLAAVDDISDVIETERRLRDSARSAAKNFDTLLGIMHLDPRALDEFVRTAQGELGAIDRALGAADVIARGGGDGGALRHRLASIGDRISTIREGAALLRFEHYEQRATAYMDMIAGMRLRPSLTGEDYLQLVNEQAGFRAELEELQTLRVRLTALRRASQIQDDAGDELIASLNAAARELAGDLGKEVQLDVDGFDSRRLPPEQRLLVKDVLHELVRNAVVHGIEESTERETAGKPRAGTIEIRPIRDALAGSFAFSVRDDGRGIDPAHIRERAVQLAIVEAPAAAVMSDSEAAGYIFLNGFTTAGEILGEAAAGAGLNTVKHRVVDESGGTISIDSELGLFCEFSIVLPAQRVSFGRN